MKDKIESYKSLVKKRTKRIRRLTALAANLVIRGSVRIQGNRCGTKGCRCKRKEDPILHGPYPYLSYRGKRTNHSILLTKDKDIYAYKAIDNYKKAMNVLIELSDVDFTILRYYSRNLKKG